MATEVFVDSEITRLRRVIVHNPDSGIARISPKRAEELLFDDIVHLPKMQAEHRIFSEILRVFVGAENVLDTQRLIKEALDNNEKARTDLIRRILDFEELPDSYFDWLSDMDNDGLATLAITGYHPGRDHILFDPIPNFIFTRDIAVVVKDHVIVTKAAKLARHRENLLTRFIFYAHPIFQGMKEPGRVINLNHVDRFPPSKRGEAVSAEGGDMMMLDPHNFLIGCSERTTQHGIDSLRDALFERSLIDQVVQINIPRDRSFMHIDTLFTQIDTDTVVCYKPIIYDGHSSNVLVHRKNGGSVQYASVKDFFRNEVNEQMRFIFSGNGESPYQEREQWTDSCNLVALKPGVAVTYDRNPQTEKAFLEAGFDVLTADVFLDGVRDGSIDPNTIKRTIITIPSAELSRARGGSHCMTCPILRMA